MDKPESSGSSHTRRSVLRLAAAGAAAAGLGATVGSLSFPEVSIGRRPKKHIILIVADAMRGDRIGRAVNGVEVTPHLNNLAAESLCFWQTFACAPWTKPSMASIFTGNLPPYHGVEYGCHTIPGNARTITSFLKEKGYFTAAIQTNPWLQEEMDATRINPTSVPYGFKHGFQIYRYEDIDLAGNSDTGLGLAYAGCGKVLESLSRLLKLIWRTRPADSPLFMYLHFMDTHQPWLLDAPGEFTGRFHAHSLVNGMTRDEIYQKDAATIRKILFEEDYGYRASAEEIEIVKAVNDEAAAYFDSNIPEMLQRLREFVDDALIVFTADHGDELYEHGCIAHGKNLFNTSLHVPLIIKGPDVPAKEIPYRVPNAAILPTLREWLGEAALPSPGLSSLEAYGRGGGRKPSGVRQPQG